VSPVSCVTLASRLTINMASPWTATSEDLIMILSSAPLILDVIVAVQGVSVIGLSLVKWLTTSSKFINKAQDNRGHTINFYNSRNIGCLGLEHCLLLASNLSWQDSYTLRLDLARKRPVGFNAMRRTVRTVPTNYRLVRSPDSILLALSCPQH